MPISGLVITLSEDAALRQAALAALQRQPAVSVGPLTGNRVPIVVDTIDDDADREVWEWLHTLPGIVLVNVAAVHFTESAMDPCASSESRAGRTTRLDAPHCNSCAGSSPHERAT
jgi:hypothetical protein